MKVELDSREMTKILLALTMAYHQTEKEAYKVVHDKLMEELDKYAMKMHGGA